MSQTGTYVLLLHIPMNTVITLPDLGKVDLPAGFYAYVDSAFGAGGLAASLKPYLAPPKNARRHIDYLRQEAQLEEIWLTAGETNREAEWTDLLLEIPGAMDLFEGFGAADCDCDSRLIYFELRPSLEDFEIGARHLFPNDLIIRAFTRDDAVSATPPDDV